MAVVVEQTIPFQSSSLDLENPHRWNDLLPLIRPSIKSVQTAKGQHILVDTALASSKFVHVAAVGRLGNFSSKLLDEKHITAIVTDQAGAGILTTKDIKNAVEHASATHDHGLVVARVGKERRVEMQGSHVVEIEVDGELELDHVLHLLGSATDSCRSSIHQVGELLKIFVKSSSTAHSRFHTEKAEGNPVLLHAGGAQGFEKAKHAVERDLKNALKAHTAQDDNVVFSVHYSDINGLSRLENYILAKEIAESLGSQSLPYRLSYSTLLDHKELARGWAVSICPVPSRLLSAQAKPKPHRSTPKSGDVSQSKPLRFSDAQMTFSDAHVRKRIESGCNAVIKAEPTITGYDTIVGDGDCGYTLRDGAKQVLQFIQGRDLTKLPEIVSALVSELEVNMGGTSGALYCIYLTALASSLASESSVAEALNVALEQLLKYTRARLGDRTMMDTLIPFIHTFNNTADVEQSIRKAKDGVEGTKKMEAKLGRSTYLDESATDGVPDPGAYGLLVLLEGMSDP